MNDPIDHPGITLLNCSRFVDPTQGKQSALFYNIMKGALNSKPIKKVMKSAVGMLDKATKKKTKHKQNNEKHTEPSKEEEETDAVNGDQVNDSFHRPALT